MSAFPRLEPALDPPESVLLVIADYGRGGGGWGPAALPGVGPFIYTRDNSVVFEAALRVARAIAETEGREARVVRFTQREDIKVFEP
jgi:hypothetical protein